MNNIFDILPLNFFNIFNSKNKYVISDCIYVLYNYTIENSTFSALKENIIFELKHYFNTHIVELEDIEGQSPNERALYVYRRLKECGWIVEEQGQNYQIYTSFEDYAIKIIETLFGLDKDNDIEYSSMIYNIYVAFRNFDIVNGHKILEFQYNSTKELMTQLKNLNTNIRHHIKKLLKDNIKNDLNELLESLLDEYQIKIVDRAFYNLTTRDHPQKYRNDIIYHVKQIRDNDKTMEAIVRNIMTSKEIGYEDAFELFDNQTNYIIDSFEGIIDIIDEISNKNEKFVASAINRITFLIGTKEDVSGKINDIIKVGQKYPEIFDFVPKVSANKVLDKDSLYFPKSYKNMAEEQIIEDYVLDEMIKEAAIKKMKYNKKYTKTSIEEKVLTKLKDNKELKGSSLLNSENDISLFVLTWLYGYSQSTKYQIEPLDEYVEQNHYRFREFIIKEI